MSLPSSPFPLPSLCPPQGDHISSHSSENLYPHQLAIGERDEHATSNYNLSRNPLTGVITFCGPQHDYLHRAPVAELDMLPAIAYSMYYRRGPLASDAVFGTQAVKKAAADALAGKVKRGPSALPRFKFGAEHPQADKSLSIRRSRAVQIQLPSSLQPSPRVLWGCS